MLFNSPVFLFLFLPIVLVLFSFLRRARAGRYLISFVGCASLVFYAFWDPRYLGLLLASIGFNFLIGNALIKHPRKSLLFFGVSINLICLGWFKYADFLIGNLNTLMGYNFILPHVVLPIGISFFTFVQLSFIVDAYLGKAQRHRFDEYLAFVTFFPHLIAGPILNHKSVLPQFHALPTSAYSWMMGAAGLTLFAIGLSKKVLFADSFSGFATPMFDSVASGSDPDFITAWMGAFAYTFQLYFDFSGYSDMAIGIGMMMGIRMPENFLSPYKSASVIEFWRRWHITLSEFLKTYIYIPLGGGRHGHVRQSINLVLTMLLGGMWHGAGWTFILWGGLHGIYLVVNHLWRRLGITSTGWGYVAICRFLTMIAVVIGWVLFRSADWNVAQTIIHSMLVPDHFVFPDKIPDVFYWVLGGFLFVNVLPNSMNIIAFSEGKGERAWYSFTPGYVWMLLTAGLLFLCLYMVTYNTNRISEFIYFQF